MKFERISFSTTVRGTKCFGTTDVPIWDSMTEALAWMTRELSAEVEPGSIKLSVSMEAARDELLRLAWKSFREGRVAAARRDLTANFTNVSEYPKLRAENTIGSSIPEPENRKT